MTRFIIAPALAIEEPWNIFGSFEYYQLNVQVI